MDAVDEPGRFTAPTVCSSVFAILRTSEFEVIGVELVLG